MIVAVMVMDLHCQGIRSLKEKRRIVLSIKDKLKKHHNISIIESDHLNLWQNLQLAIAMVSTSKEIVDRVFGKIEDFVLFNYPVKVGRITKEFL